MVVASRRVVSASCRHVQRLPGEKAERGGKFHDALNMVIFYRMVFLRFLF